MTASPQRFTPRVQPVRAMRYQSTHTSQAMFNWVNQMKDYGAEWAGRFLVICGPERARYAVGNGDWVVVEYDGALTVLPNREFRDRYVASTVEPETEEVPPW